MCVIVYQFGHPFHTNKLDVTEAISWIEASNFFTKTPIVIDTGISFILILMFKP